VQLAANSATYLIAAFPAAQGEVAAVRLDMSIMRSVVDDITFGKTGRVYIANSFGEVIAHPDLQFAPGHVILEDPAALGIVRGQAQHEEPILHRTLTGALVMSVANAIMKRQWFVFAELSIFEAFSVTLTAFGLAGIAMVISFVSGVTSTTRFMEKMIGQPLELLRQGAEQLSINNLDHRVEVLRDDEFGLVAGTFNKMADALASEIAERERYEQQLRHDAFHDGLTALPNRALLLDRLEHNIARFQRNPSYCYAVVFMDLDRFKIVNDSLGHTAGDALLFEIASRLKHSVRSIDTVARLGGDEFVILLEDYGTAKEVEVVVHRIMSQLAIPVQIDGRDLITTASIGIVIADASYSEPDDLLRDADIAMYHAKAKGKGRFEYFSDHLREHVVFRLNMEADLHKALERSEFLLHYQPITALESNKIIGFEALVRWDHPGHGLVSPGTFIPFAEETGSIIPMGLWVIEQACRQMTGWNEQFAPDGLLTISVNLSASQLVQPGFANQVEQILKRTGLPGNLLNLEITEGAIVGDAIAASRVLEQLKSLGIAIHLDDFGTGYSSLSYLHTLPLDVLKIDRIFVDTMEKETSDSGLVRNIIAIAHELGIEVVAEGIETSSQLELLVSYGCNYGQGYLIARPQAAEDATALLAQPQFA